MSAMIKNVNLYPAKRRTVRGDKWGYINDQGIFVINPKFQDAMDFEENGLAVVKVGDAYGIIDENENYVVRPKYESITSFSEGRSQVVDKEGFKVIDEKGKILTKKAYSFIGNYRNNRAIFADTASEGRYLYGYLDEWGNEVIPLTYESANNFKNGKAVVKIKENDFAIIDLGGKVIEKFSYAYVGDLSEGLLAFQEKNSGPYGYINERGDIVIQAQFDTAQSFQDGRAVVGISEGIKNGYGLIDRQGNYMIKPQYNDLLMLGSSRVAVGEAKVADKPYYSSVYAIATTEGKLLTDFKYYGLLRYEKGFASAYDDTHTFFLDLEGRVAKYLPIVSGSGSLTFVWNLIRALVDMKTAYYSMSGKLIWKENTIITLNEQYEVREIKFKPNKDYLVYVPKVAGMRDHAAQQKVNQKLKELSQVKDIPADEQLDYAYTGDFSIQLFKKDLLVLELSGYNFPFGAAHGMPYKNYPHINLVNGRFYELADLFKKDSDYVKVISEIIEDQIESGDTPYSGYLFPDAYKGIRADQPFYISENDLYIYFEPYEIAAYAAGFPTFKIPFDQLRSIIDIDGEFWRAFHY